MHGAKPEPEGVESQGFGSIRIRSKEIVSSGDRISSNFFGVKSNPPELVKIYSGCGVEFEAGYFKIMES